MRVLLVENSDDSADVLVRLLTMAGHDVRFSNNGPDSLEVAKEFRPQVAIVDIRMPKISGYELAVHLRAASLVKIRIIALSGVFIDEGRDLAAGFDDHVMKPAGLFAILRAITPK